MSNINIKKLKSLKKLQGNFLALENGKVFTTEKRTHCLFMDEGEAKGDEIFKKYILDFCAVCSKVKNKPTLANFNLASLEDEAEKNLGVKYKKFYTDERECVEHDKNGEGGFNEHIMFSRHEPAILFADKDKFYKVLDDALAVKSVYYPNYEEDFYLILNCLENFDFDYESFKLILGICYFRGITFIIRIKDKEKFISKYSKEAFDEILFHCQANFCGSCGLDKISLRKNGKTEIFDLKTGKIVK